MRKSVHPTARRTAAGVLACLVAGVVALAGLLAVPNPAQADTGRVRGAVVGAHGDRTPKVTVSWFTSDWVFLGSRKAYGGGYSLVLDPGTYHLQFTDKRPVYDVDRYAPADVTVTVTADATTVKSVHLHVGASIGGTVRAGGKVAPGARVVAANTDRNSFETTANQDGQFALGGLPPGTYSVFTYDKAAAWVGKSVYLRKLRSGVFHTVNPSLTTRAGRLVVDLYAGDQPYPGVAYLTAVSSKNGQFWTQKASHGSVTFQGLYPGRYTVVVPGVGDYLGGTLKVEGKVKAGRTAFGSLRLTQRGASISGRVVDSEAPGPGLGSVAVTVYGPDGRELGVGTTAADGSFTVGGQLTTATGLTVVAAPGGSNPPYLQGVHYCRFASATLSGVAVTTGQATSVGALTLPHAANTGGEDAGC